MKKNDIAIFIIFVLIIALFLRVDFIFYILYVIVGVYALSLWYAPRSAKKIVVHRRLADHAFLGEIVPVHVRLHNRSRLPVPWLEAADSVPARLRRGEPTRFAFSLSGHGTADFSYQVRAAQRGYYRVGPLRLKLGDFFGFSESHAYVDAVYLTVYPRITPLVRLGLPARLPFGTVASRQRLFEDPARPAGVREYRSGDSLRQINWKVSAHVSGPGRDLMVKTLEPAISLETTLLLNMHRPDYRSRNSQDVAEWAIEVAASLAAHLSNSRQPVGLITNGRDPLRQHGRRLEALPFDKETGRLLLDLESGAEPSLREPSLREPSFRRSEPFAAAPGAPTPIAPRPGRAHLMKVLETLARVEFGQEAPFHDWAPGATTHLSWGITVLAITPRADEATCNMMHRLARVGFNPVLLVVEGIANFGAVRERARRLGFTAFKIIRPADYQRLAGAGSLRQTWQPTGLGD